MCFLSSRAPYLGSLTSIYLVNGNMGQNLKRIYFPCSELQFHSEKIGHKVVKIAFPDTLSLTALFAKNFLKQ